MNLILNFTLIIMLEMFIMIMEIFKRGWMQNSLLLIYACCWCVFGVKIFANSRFQRGCFSVIVVITIIIIIVTNVCIIIRIIFITTKRRYFYVLCVFVLWEISIFTYRTKYTKRYFLFWYKKNKLLKLRYFYSSYVWSRTSLYFIVITHGT